MTVVGVYGCNQGYFKCREPTNGRRCVAERKLCDGNADCTDESDEDPQNCNGQALLVTAEGNMLCCMIII